MEIKNLKNREEVKEWLRSFHKLMKKCPSNIWFFSNGNLHIMVTGKDGEAIFREDSGGVDHDYKIDNESDHLWEGGDW